MNLIGLIVTLLIAAVFLWGIDKIPQLDGGLKQLIKIVVYVVAAILVILFLAGLFGYHGGIRLGA